MSTNNDEFVVLNKPLNVVQKRQHITLKTACAVENRFFFGDMLGMIYEAVFNGEDTS